MAKNNVNPKKKDTDLSLEELSNQSTVENTDVTDVSEAPSVEVTSPEMQLEIERDKYIRLYSEFENFRRRTTKDRLEWMQTASKELVVNLLPVIDDLERAIKAMENLSETEKKAVEGFDLINKKLMGILQKTGLKSMDSIGKLFDVEIHEAITQFPAPSPDLKGKVIDEVEKGYFLSDKVIRFAKVVIGS